MTTNDHVCSTLHVVWLCNQHVCSMLPCDTDKRSASVVSCAGRYVYADSIDEAPQYRQSAAAKDLSGIGRLYVPCRGSKRASPSRFFALRYTLVSSTHSASARCHL